MIKTKKGFTIAEIVIALAIIAIVSLTATSLVLTSRQVSKNTRDKLLAVNLCDNSIAIFQSAANDSRNIEELSKAFAHRLKESLDIEIPETIEADATIYLDRNWQQIDVKDSTEAKVICTFTFKAESDGIVTFEISVNFGSIYSAFYQMKLARAL